MTYFETPGGPAWAPPPFPPPPVPPQRPRRAGWIVTVVLLSVVLIAFAVAAVWFFLQLQNAKATIRDNEREIDEQRELIERKDSFGAAMDALLGETTTFTGLPLGNLVPWDDYQLLTERAWDQRWNADALDQVIADTDAARADHVARRDAAAAQAATEAAGGAYDRVIGQLGSGYVSVQIDNADALCAKDVLACVMSDDPLVVHVDAADDAREYTTDWIRTGIAYHEFAHVLQYANPDETDTAVTAFGGDYETMADCFALTFLDGWTLDHRVWVSDYTYWDVSVGYGYVCNDSQKQAIRDWRAAIGVKPQQLGVGVTG